MGRRRGRLPGRQLPGALERVERQVPRHRARLLEGRRRRRSPSWPTASPAQSICIRETAAAPTPASTSSPPTTASRCTTSSATTTSTTRPTARTTATARTTTSWNCGVEGPTDDPTIVAAREQTQAQLPGHAAPLAGRADALRRRRDRPHPARQQQRLLPGQRDQLVRLGPRRAQARLARLHARPDRAARRATRVSAAPASSRDAGSAARWWRTWPGFAPTASR